MFCYSYADKLLLRSMNRSGWFVFKAPLDVSWI